MAKTWTRCPGCGQLMDAGRTVCGSCSAAARAASRQRAGDAVAGAGSGLAAMAIGPVGILFAASVTGALCGLVPAGIAWAVTDGEVFHGLAVMAYHVGPEKMAWLAPLFAGLVALKRREWDFLGGLAGFLAGGLYGGGVLWAAMTLFGAAPLIGAPRAGRSDFFLLILGVALSGFAARGVIALWRRNYE